MNNASNRDKSETASTMQSPAVDAPERMQCMEIWGGNLEITKSFAATGLDVYVRSRPFLDSQSGGGDIYYLTSCASGRISRILLADVSGHGKNAADLAISLRDLMRQNVNKISQQVFVKQVNQEFGDMAQEQGFATAVIATFFEPTRSLSISIAGHPYPVYYSQKKKSWSLIDSALADGKLENLPLGIHDESAYPNFKMPTEVGDMFLLYTDAFVESIDAQGKQIGVAGLLNMLNDAPTLDAANVIDYLENTISGMSDQNLKDDDATAIVGRFTNSKTSFTSNLVAPFRLFRPVRDRTQIE